MICIGHTEKSSFVGQCYQEITTAVESQTQHNRLNNLLAQTDRHNAGNAVVDFMKGAARVSCSPAIFLR